MDKTAKVILWGAGIAGVGGLIWYAVTRKTKPTPIPGTGNGTLSGVVSNEAGDPVGGISVSIDGVAITETDADGSYNTGYIPNEKNATVLYSDPTGTYLPDTETITIAGNITTNIKLLAASDGGGGGGGTLQTLVVNFSPTNATVVVAGIVVVNGQTLSLPAGNYEWSASAPNHNSQQSSVTVVEGTNPPLNITLSLSGTNPTTGTVVISFSPSNATVYLNGNPYNSVQYPPGTVWSFSPGNYQWSVSAPGYITQSGNFSIVAGVETVIGPVNLVKSSGITLPPGTGFGIIPGSLVADADGIHFDLANWDVGVPSGGQGQVSGNGLVTLNSPMPTFIPYDEYGNGGPGTTDSWWVAWLPLGVLLPPRATAVHMDVPWSVAKIINGSDVIADLGQQDYRWLEANGYLSPGFSINVQLVLELFTSQGYLSATQFAPLMMVTSSV